MIKEFGRLGRRWTKRFNAEGPKFAKGFADAAKMQADRTLFKQVQQANMKVRFTLTPTMQDAYDAVIGEQVGLIRSIAQEHLADVQGLVMRSVQQGRSLGDLTKAIQERYELTRERAALIARDQNNKATATFTRVRHLELAGEDAEAIWVHSAGGRVPRPSHVAATGKLYKVKQGMKLDGVWTWPGVEINCRCVSKLVLKGI